MFGMVVFHCCGAMFNRKACLFLRWVTVSNLAILDQMMWALVVQKGPKNLGSLGQTVYKHRCGDPSEKNKLSRSLKVTKRDTGTYDFL